MLPYTGDKLYQDLPKKSLSWSTLKIRTNNNDDTKNVYVKLLTSKNGGIPQLQIRASGYSYRNSGGLCGYYDLNANNDQFIWTKSVTTSQTQLSTVNNMAAFWRWLNTSI